MLFLGDTHGNWNHIFWVIKQKGITNEIIYHVGDIGVGFTSHENEIRNLTHYNEKFKKFGIIFYGIRGNHDDPQYFDGGIDMSNLKLLPDYTLLTLENKGVLGVGGATSIDRKQRIDESNSYNKYGKTPKRSWWEGEKFLLDDDELMGFAENTIDIVVTHTSPAFCYPRNDNGFGPIVERFAKFDSKLKTELLIERGSLSQMYEILNKSQNIDKWFYGHFHKSELTKEGNTNFICLDVNELYNLIDYSDFEKEMNEKYGE